MRVTIRRTPPIREIDGIRLEGFRVGQQYEVGNSVGALLLAEEWAEPVPLNAPKPFTPFSADDPFDSLVLRKDSPKPINDRPSSSPRALAADRAPRKRRRPR